MMPAQRSIVMTNDSDPVQKLFAQALRKPENERRLFLDEACGSDTEQRGLIEGLLAAHAAAGKDGFFGHPTDCVSEVRAVVAANEEPGTIIGRYKLLELIGEGGFGAVYMAEQTEPVRRKVALKIIKLGMDTKQVIARFEAERQALAMMDHANIAKVLDAGATETGRPYFVMELVKGAASGTCGDARHL